MSVETETTLISEGGDVSSAKTTAGTEPHPTVGLIDIAPSQTEYAEVGSTISYDLTVTNLGPGSRIVDLSWNQPPAGWTAAIFSSDGVTPLGDANSNSKPDVSLGPAGSMTDSEDIVMKIGVPLSPDVSQTVTNVTADAGSTDTDMATLNTTVFPFLYVDRWANPTTINRLGLGSNEITTITLDLEGRGVIIPGVVENAADVVFVVDDTASMAKAIDGLKNDINNLTDRLAENVSSLRLGLVSFKDVPPWGPWEIDVDIDLTFDVDAFKAAVNALVAAGGADDPEDGDIALEIAANLTWRPGNVTLAMVHITDAPVHDNPHLPSVARWAWQTKEIHTNTVGVGAPYLMPPDPPGCYIDPDAEYWLRRTAENGSGSYEEWYWNFPPPMPPLCPTLTLGDTLLDGLIVLIPPIDLAAKDPMPLDSDPMVRDVLPPYISIVPGTFRDPATSTPRSPDYMGVDGSGNTVLEWNVSAVRVNESWHVAFDVKSSLAGIVPTDVYGLSRASYLNWSGAHKETLFPEVMVKVLGPAPVTTLIVGSPNYASVDTWVKSTTPLTFFVVDVAGTGIASTWYRVDGVARVNYTATGPFTLSGDGRHVLEWYSEDVLGVAEPLNIGELIVDDTPPITDSLIGSPNYVSTDIFIRSSTPISLQPVDPGVEPVGLDTTTYRIGSGPATPYSAPFTLAGEGLHIIKFWSDDLIGNAETAVSLTLIVDDTPPMTSATIGLPHHQAADDFITSSTPITLLGADGGVIPVGLQSVLYRIDGAITATYASPFTITGEGRHDVEFLSVDLLGNTESTGSFQVVVDDTPPTTAIAVGTPSHLAIDYYVTSSTPITLQASDGDAIPVGLNATYYRIDGGSPVAYVSPFTLAGEGAHAVEFWSADILGNTEAVKYITIIVDDTPPGTSISFGTPSHTGTDTFVRSTTPITLQSADGGADPVGLGTIYMRIDAGNPTIYTASFTLSGEGLHTVEFWSVDILGNTEPVTPVRIIVDDTPPTTSVAVGTPNYTEASLYVTSDTAFTFTSVDGGAVPVGLATVECSVDGVTWVDCPSVLELTGADGSRTILFRATDLLGNAEDERSISVILDNTAPTTTIGPVSGTFTKDTFFTLSAIDDGSGVQATRYRIDGGSWVVFAAAFNLSVGEHDVTYYSLDNLGNVEAERTLHVTIEGAPPPPPPPPPTPDVTVNYKPMVAMIFALMLGIMGLWAARRRPWKGVGTKKAAAKAFLVFSLPVVLAEAGTGAVSHFTGALSIPPLIGLGTIVDVSILLAGLVVVMLRFRKTDQTKQTQTTAEDTVLQQQPAA